MGRWESVATCDDDGGGVDIDAVPEMIGRYLPVLELGRGGMGRVYQGYDPELQRVVAIKVLDGAGRLRPGTIARFRREAEALARLAHPGVVEVFEVGLDGGAPYLVMELVPGETLRAWLRTRRSVEEILRVFTDAAHALHAAHVAGVVHRDFKPDNVMLSRDGRVRVLDFGLAAIGEACSTAPTRHVPDAGARASSLTETGAVLGTPAYMSPEQHVGDPTDAQTDQFSFCVALCEALYGERPFSGKYRAALHRAVVDGRIELPAPRNREDRRLQKVLRRGLSVSPEDRWPSMEALVDALRRPRPRVARFVVTACAAAFALGGGIGLADASPAACDGATRLGAVYTDGDRDAIAAAIEGTQLPFAPQTEDRVLSVLDDHARAWTAAWDATCEAEAEAREARLCLERDLVRLGEQLPVLAESTADTLAALLPAMRSLPDPGRCLTPDAGLDRVPTPQDAGLAVEVREARELLARSEALGMAGRFEEATRAGRDARTAAIATDYGPAIAETGLNLARGMDMLGRQDDALELLESTYYLAIEAEHDRVAIECAHRIVQVGAELRLPPARLEHWLSAAGALLERHPEAEKLHARQILRRAYAAVGAEDFDEGVRLHRAAREAFAEHGLDRDDLAQSANALGVALLKARRYPEALEQLQEGFELSVEDVGEDHPYIAASHSNLALALWSAQRFDEALDHAQAATKLAAATLGTGHPQTAGAQRILGAVLQAQARWDESLPVLQAAADTLTRTLGESSPGTLSTKGLLAGTYLELGRIDDAEALLRKQLDILDASGRGRSRSAIEFSLELARVLARADRRDEARAILGRTLALTEDGAEEALRDATLRSLAELDAPADAPPTAGPAAQGS